MTAAQLTHDKPEVNPWLIAVAVMLAVHGGARHFHRRGRFAVPSVGSLSASNDEATWVLTSYLVANAIVLPASSWFSLRFGRKRFLLFCIALFTASSFVCGAATSLGMILISRYVEDPAYINDARPGKFDGIGLGLLAVWLRCLQIILDEGQEDDWFGAPWIRWATAILIVSFVVGRFATTNRRWICVCFDIEI